MQYGNDERSNCYQNVINFWFSDRVSKLWFKPTPALDKEILNKFHHTWLNAKKRQLLFWEKSAEGCLALAIVLDQFPLNMFRGTEKSFSTESDAIRVSRHAIARKFDRQLNPSRASFLYLPFMHSENIEDQNLSVALFEKAQLQSNLRYAKHHREIIKRFGRFPHRNSILGRTNTKEELEYLSSAKAFKG